MDSSFSHIHWQHPVVVLLNTPANEGEREEAKQAELHEQTEQDVTDAYFATKLKEFSEKQALKQKTQWVTHPLLVGGDYGKRFGQTQKVERTTGVYRRTAPAKKRKRDTASGNTAAPVDDINPSQLVR